jgi:hypothetical protein
MYSIAVGRHRTRRSSDAERAILSQKQEDFCSVGTDFINRQKNTTRTEIHKIDQNETPNIAADSSLALRVELHFSHQSCSFIDRPNQYPQLRHQIRHEKRVRKAFRASQAIAQPRQQQQHKTGKNGVAHAAEQILLTAGCEEYSEQIAPRISLFQQP